MKSIPFVMLFALMTFAAASRQTAAQTNTGGSGKVVTGRTNQNTNKPKPNAFDISRFDFRNYTYPDYDRSGGDQKTFTLKNGQVVKTLGTPNYKLRKTYYFDLTGDKRNEAITHIIANGCEFGCESSSLFFIFTADGDQPKLLWKIVIGGDTMGGLKIINFTNSEIVIETFGEAALDGWLVKTNADIEKNPKLVTRNYTRFVFTRDADGYTQTDRTIIPLAKPYLRGYRAQIVFNDKP